MFQGIKKRKIFRIIGQKRRVHSGLWTTNDSPLTKSQVILEFTFCMVIVLLMVFGITKILTWTGREYVYRMQGHDKTLYLDVPIEYEVFSGPYDTDPTIEDGPIRQIDPYYYTPVKLNAIWGEH